MGFLSDMGQSFISRGFSDLNEAFGTGDRRREAEYRDKLAYDSKVMELQQKDIKGKIALAKSLGIHPSVMLGSSAASAQLVGSMSTSGPSNFEYSPSPAKATEAQAASEALSLENQKLQNDYLKLQINDYQASIVARQNKNASPVSPIVMQPSEITMGSNGVTAGTHPSMVNIEMPGGERLNIPDQNLIETGEVLPIVMQMSNATGIPVNTLYTLASLGLLAIPFGGAVRGAYGGYRAYKAAKAAKSAAGEAARLARRAKMK